MSQRLRGRSSRLAIGILISMGVVAGALLVPRWVGGAGPTIADVKRAERAYDAERIANIWNLEDGCGGSGA